MLYSPIEKNVKITIEQSVITCSSVFDRNVGLLALASKTSTKAGSIYVENSNVGIFSSDNIF
jgi:hypothetical protein